MTYDQLVLETQALCDGIANFPSNRLAVRKAFYEKFGKNGLLNYGTSELAFLEWEIRRGVLNPMDNTPLQSAGSLWWRDVNLRFIFFAELAGRMSIYGIKNDNAPQPVKAWLNFIETPNAKNWYRAHNTTILEGFYKFREKAKLENDAEIAFLNITLYRLMFAQALVEGCTIFGELGEWAANPEGFAVSIITSLPSFYPDTYPLTSQDLEIIKGRAPEEQTAIGKLSDKLNFFAKFSKNSEIQKLAKRMKEISTIVDTAKELDELYKMKDISGIEDVLVYILDNDIILPHIRKLYEEAASWNDAPFLPQFLDTNDIPDYPNMANKNSDPHE